MRRAERLFRLVQILRGASRALTAAEIADRLEVSRRTVYRDIAHLVGSGAPIDGAAGVGYLLRSGFDAPSITFTYEQLEAIAFGARAVRTMLDPRMAEAAVEALAKIEASLPEELADRLRGVAIFSELPANWPPPSKFLGLARTAISAREVLVVEYLSLNGTESRRSVWPLALINFGPVWLLNAWCELRNDFRNFRLDRCRQVLPAGRTYSERPGCRLSDYLAGAKASITGGIEGA